MNQVRQLHSHKLFLLMAVVFTVHVDYGCVLTLATFGIATRICGWLIWYEDWVGLLVAAVLSVALRT